MPKREIEILQLLSNGYSNKEMAYNLYLTEGTVKNYISNISFTPSSKSQVGIKRCLRPRKKGL
jgi:DNA-binding CsgD family transcriptional regulator